MYTSEYVSATLGRYMKPAQHYLEISQDGNLNLSAGESRKFLRSIGVAGEIILTPGHSPDSVSLITDASLAFTGDALTPASTEAAREQIDAVWENLRLHQVKKIYPGHGPLRQMDGSHLS